MAYLTPTSPPPCEPIHGALRTLFETGLYHDLTIRSGDRTWKVHRAVICPQSKYFTKACTGGFVEAETREIVLQGDEPAVVERMLHYFYTGEDGDGSFRSLREDMVMDAKMYAIADKYDLDGLKRVAKAGFMQALFEHWDTDQFIVAAEVVYTSTPDSDRGLRDVVTALTWRKQTTLLARKEVQTLLNDLAAFAKDLMQEFCKAASTFARDCYCDDCCQEVVPTIFKRCPKCSNWFPTLIGSAGEEEDSSVVVRQWW